MKTQSGFVQFPYFWPFGAGSSYTYTLDQFSDSEPIQNVLFTAAKPYRIVNTVYMGASHTFRDVAKNGSTFVAVSSNGTVRTSTDFETWTSRTAANALEWYGVAWGNSLFVAVANSGSGNRVMTSPDGTTWTARTSPDAGWQKVLWSETLGLFVAVAQSGANRVMTSPDGTTWTGRSVEASTWRAIAENGAGRLVAVASAGTNRVMYSDDGADWTAVAVPAGEWFDVTWNGSKFYAVGNTGGGVIESADGETWSSLDDNLVHACRSIAWNGEQFCRVSLDEKLDFSDDGETWTEEYDGSSSMQALAVRSFGGEFYVVGLNGTAAYTDLAGTGANLPHTVEVLSDGGIRIYDENRSAVGIASVGLISGNSFRLDVTHTLSAPAGWRIPFTAIGASRQSDSGQSRSVWASLLNRLYKNRFEATHDATIVCSLLHTLSKVDTVPPANERQALEDLRVILRGMKAAEPIEKVVAAFVRDTRL